MVKDGYLYQTSVKRTSYGVLHHVKNLCGDNDFLIRRKKKKAIKLYTLVLMQKFELPFKKLRRSGEWYILCGIQRSGRKRSQICGLLNQGKGNVEPKSTS